jgi:hypothetical protein
VKVGIRWAVFGLALLAGEDRAGDLLLLVLLGFAEPRQEDDPTVRRDFPAPG